MHMVNSPTAKLSLVVARKKTLDVAEKLAVLEDRTPTVPRFGALSTYR